MRLVAELPHRSDDAYYRIVHCVLAPSFNECGYLIIIEDETMSELPIIGAALLVEEMPVHRDWYLEKPRDLEIQSFINADVLIGDWKPMAEEIKKQLDGHQGRLGIHGPFWGFTIDTPDPDVRTVVQKRLDQALDVCEFLGADQVVIHSPFTTWSYNHLDDGFNGREEITENTHLTLAPAIRRAENMGVTFVIENIEDINPFERLKLADSFNSSAVAVSIDTGHAHYAHGNTGAAPVDHFVHAAANRLQHVHLQDADGYADRHWATGDGTVNWKAVFAALKQYDSNPRLILEMRDHNDIKKSMKYLEAIGLGQ